MRRIFVFLIAFLFSLSAVFARPKVALVLSGGVAYGLAEIPLLEAIEEEGIPIDYVVGTSFGSIVGALYSSGYTPKQIRDIMTDIDFIGILNEKTVFPENVPPRAFSPQMDNYFSFNISENGIGATPGLLGDQGILTTLDNYLSRTMHIENFDDLYIPFRAVATNIADGKAVVIDSGSIVSAVRASLSIPMVWTPAPLDVNGGIYAYDGGLANNLPISVAKELGADVVIAIDVLNNSSSDITDVKDLYSAFMRFVYLVISNSSSSQYEMADIVLKPDLSEYQIMDFIHSKELIDLGQKCVEDNREEIHNIALRLEENGCELKPKSYNRLGEYDKLPEPVIESIVVKDISYMPPCPLPLAVEFNQFLGKQMSNETKKSLESKLNAERKVFHLSSFSYFLKEGTSENSRILELQANHYFQDNSKFFLGGENFVSVGAVDYDLRTHLLVSPNLYAGFFIVKPIEILGLINFANITTANFSVFPLLKVFKDDFKFQLDFGITGKYGSLETKSNFLYKDRIVAIDRGLYANAGLQFHYIDIFNSRLGIDYELINLNSNRKFRNLFGVYFEAIFNNLGNSFTEFDGIKAELRAKVGGDINSITIKDENFRLFYNVQFNVKQNFEVIKTWTALGYDVRGAINRYPYELNMGYSDYGGINGMCGYAYGTYRRDYIIAGISYHQKIFDFARMPVIAIVQGKVSASDSYKPFAQFGEAPSDSFFAGFSGVDFGFGIYLSLKTPFGAVMLGGSFNQRGRWCLVLGLN